MDWRWLERRSKKIDILFEFLNEIEIEWHELSGFFFIFEYCIHVLNAPAWWYFILRRRHLLLSVSRLILFTGWCVFSFQSYTCVSSNETCALWRLQRFDELQLQLEYLLEIFVINPDEIVHKNIQETNSNIQKLWAFLIKISRFWFITKRGDLIFFLFIC